MDSDLDSKFQQRNRFFCNSYDEGYLRVRRSELQTELRRSKRSEEISKKRKLKEFEIDWIEINKPPVQQYHLEDLSGFIEALTNPNKKICLMGIYGIRKLVSQMNPSIDIIMDSGAISLIISCLSFDDSPQIQYEAAWTITNICTGSHSYIETIIEKGGLKGLTHMLLSNIDEVKEQALWGIGNIAADSSSCRNMILEGPTLQFLGKIVIDSQVLSLVKQGCWAASNICRTKPTPPLGKVQILLPGLAKGLMLHKELKDIASDILWSFAFVTENSHEGIETMIKLDIFPLVINFARSQVLTNTLPALKIIGNVIGGNDLQAEFVLKQGGLKALKDALVFQFKPVKREAIWAISNLCAGTYEQLEILLKSGIMKILIEMAYEEPFEIQKEIGWAFANFASCGYDVTWDAVKEGIFVGLVPLLENKDSSIVLVALMTVEKIFEYCEGEDLKVCLEKFEEPRGVEVLYKLQHHPQVKVYEKAAMMIEKYFDGETEYQALVDNINELANYIL